MLRIREMRTRMSTCARSHVGRSAVKALRVFERHLPLPILGERASGFYAEDPTPRSLAAPGAGDHAGLESRIRIAVAAKAERRVFEVPSP